MNSLPISGAHVNFTFSLIIDGSVLSLGSGSVTSSSASSVCNPMATIRIKQMHFMADSLSQIAQFPQRLNSFLFAINHTMSSTVMSHSTTVYWYLYCRVSCPGQLKENNSSFCVFRREVNFQFGLRTMCLFSRTFLVLFIFVDGLWSNSRFFRDFWSAILFAFKRSDHSSIYMLRTPRVYSFVSPRFN